MNYSLLGVFFLGFTGSLIYKYKDVLQIHYLKYKTNVAAKQITIDFFMGLIYENRNIELDEAILKFENANEDFIDIETFSKKKYRTADQYRAAYYNLFMEAKKRINKK